MSTQYPTHTAHSNPQNAPQATFICKGTEEEGKYKSYVRLGGEPTHQGPRRKDRQNCSVTSISFSKTITKSALFGIQTPEVWTPKKQSLSLCALKPRSLSPWARKVKTTPLGFQNGVGLLCTAACCGRDHCGERGRRATETDKGEQQEGNRYQAWEGPGHKQFPPKEMSWWV